MTHFSTSKAERTTPIEWLPVGAKIGALANDWAMRSDLVAFVGSGAGVGKGAPAIFDPASAEIEINVPISFGHATPEHVGDMTERRQQFEFPKATGAILHESMHARFSTWDLRKAAEELPAKVCEALHLLEESRIEALGVRIMPNNKAFLRACALEIVLGDIKDGALDKLNTTRQAAHLLGLTYARVDAGVIDFNDITPVREVISRVLPSDLVIDLTSIWREFQTLNADFDVARMYELATEWERLVKEQVDENGEDDSESGGSEMSEAMSEFLSEIADALEEAQGNAEVGAIADAQEQQTKEEMQESAQQSMSKNEEQRSHEKEASKVFSKSSSPESSGSRSRLVSKRKPTSEERVSAVQISQALEKAKYRDRVRIETASALPPGRLRSRALVQGQAYRDRGVMIETEPFQRVQRKHTDDPNLTIGVMVDISGSMSSAMEPMASAAWILSEATRRVQGKVAMVYYGNSVFPTLKAGQHLEEVSVYTASDGTEEFDGAFKALDGALGLLNGSGARLLVIVSDGQYTREQVRKAEQWIARCGREGVGVLWIGAGHYGSNGSEYCQSQHAVYARMGSSATDAASAIGKAATQALTKAGATRA